jgi:hypothetical protein
MLFVPLIINITVITKALSALSKAFQQTLGALFAPLIIDIMIITNLSPLSKAFQQTLGALINDPYITHYH